MSDYDNVSTAQLAATLAETECAASAARYASDSVRRMFSTEIAAIRAELATRLATEPAP